MQQLQHVKLLDIAKKTQWKRHKDPFLHAQDTAVADTDTFVRLQDYQRNETKEKTTNSDVEMGQTISWRTGSFSMYPEYYAYTGGIGTQNNKDPSNWRHQRGRSMQWFL